MPRAIGDPGPAGAAYNNRANDLCFRCDNACGGCSWSKDFTPVEGWTAEKTKIWIGRTTIDSYRITACPEFAGKEPPRLPEKQDINVPYIAHTLRMLRHMMRLSTRQMADRMHCSAHVIAMLEAGNGDRCSVDTLLQVADDLGLDMDEILIRRMG